MPECRRVRLSEEVLRQQRQVLRLRYKAQRNGQLAVLPVPGQWRKQEREELLPQAAKAVHRGRKMKLAINAEKCPQNHKCPSIAVCPKGAITQADER
jgi:predicted metal-binding protein